MAQFSMESDKGKEKEEILSHIRFVDLSDRIQPLPGDFSTISVLNPVIYIEREEIDSDKQEFQLMEDQELRDGESWDDNALKAVRRRHDIKSKINKTYRINVSFNLEIEIKDFDSCSRFFNKFFDSVSLRYLFDDGEDNDFAPASDGLASADLTESRTKQLGATLGLSPSAATGATPSLSVHVQKEHSIQVARKLNSWRLGVDKEWHRLNHDIKIQRLWNYPPRRWYFQVKGEENTGEEHHRPEHVQRCHAKTLGYVSWPSNYGSAIHWHWQTVHSAHMWAPEIYQCVSLPVTVTRVVPVKDVDFVWEDSRHSKRAIEEKFLHFHFEVDVHVRELGHSMSLKGLKNFVTLGLGSTVPPEERIGEDTGKPIRPDLWGFCVSCKQKDIVDQLSDSYRKSKSPSTSGYYGWPENRTLVIRKEAAQYYKAHAIPGEITIKLPSEKEMIGLWRERRKLSKRKHDYDLKKLKHDTEVLQWEMNHDRQWGTAGTEDTKPISRLQCGCAILPVCHCLHCPPSCANLVQCSSPAKEVRQQKMTVDVREISRGRGFERSTSPVCRDPVFSRSLSSCAPRRSRSRSLSPLTRTRACSSTFSPARRSRSSTRHRYLNWSPERHAHIVRFDRSNSHSPTRRPNSIRRYSVAQPDFGCHEPNETHQCGRRNSADLVYYARDPPPRRRFDDRHMRRSSMSPRRSFFVKRQFVIKPRNRSHEVRRYEGW